jgi:type I restriction enzyme S subunit
MSKAPKIRFKKDDGTDYPEWCEKLLGEIVIENLDPVPTPKGGYRRVGVYCHAKGTFQEDVPADKVLEVDKMFRIHKDNLIVNITFAWEHAIAIVKEEDEGLLVSHRFPEYEFIEGQVPTFYKYFIMRPYMRQKMYLASPGGAGRNRVLKRSEFLTIPVIAPIDPEEQTKIADFLSQVDEVIQASEKEVATLQQLKKGMMQKIFSQEVRFKKDDGTDYPEWEEKKLGRDFTFKNGINASRDAFRSGGIPCIGVSDVFKCLPIVADNIIGTVNISEQEIEKNKVCYGDILFQRSSETQQDIGHACVYIDNAPAVYNGFVICGKTNSLEYNPLFMHYELQNQRIRKQTISLGAGAQHYNIGQESLSQIIVKYPHPEEQAKIADFFSSMDTAITAAQEELGKYKELKKGLLQQMFV